MAFRLLFSDDSYIDIPAMPFGSSDIKYCKRSYNVSGYGTITSQEIFGYECSITNGPFSMEGYTKLDSLVGKTTKSGISITRDSSGHLHCTIPQSVSNALSARGITPPSDLFYGFGTQGSSLGKDYYLVFNIYKKTIGLLSVDSGVTSYTLPTPTYVFNNVKYRLSDDSNVGALHIYGQNNSNYLRRTSVFYDVLGRQYNLPSVQDCDSSANYSASYYLYISTYLDSKWYTEDNVTIHAGSVNPSWFELNNIFFGEDGWHIHAEDGESIYSPGGDSSDPHNPYPSGSSPYTVDPLDSGVETDSPNTDGTWELPFDNVPDSPATVHSVNLGLYNAYALSAMEVMELANYLFSGITEVGENLVKLIWGSKRDVVISLIEFPLMVTNQGVEEIRFIFDTALAGMFHGKQLTNEYLPIDFGTIEVPRYSGTFYDFEPYTTLTLYIPYIGYIDLKPTEVIGSTLSISGYVHLTTGEINVNVKSSRTGILGSYSGTIGRMLPIADADATEIYSAIIKTTASLGAVAVAGVGAASASSAAGAVSAPSHHAVDVAQTEYQNAIKDWGTATKGIRGKQAEMTSKGVSYEAAVSNYNEQRSKYNQVNKAADNAREDFHDALSEAGSNAIGAVTTGFNVSRGTVMTSSNGRLSPQRCFLRIEVPHQNVSRNQKILGYPANSSDSLNSDRLHGYTELRSIELSIPRATLTEIQELENILRGGFYLP